jgi:hypothetical protein
MSAFRLVFVEFTYPDIPLQLVLYFSRFSL